MLNDAPNSAVRIGKKRASLLGGFSSAFDTTFARDTILIQKILKIYCFFQFYGGIHG